MRADAVVGERAEDAVDAGEHVNLLALQRGNVPAADQRGTREEERREQGDTEARGGGRRGESVPTSRAEKSDIDRQTDKQTGRH